VQKISFFLEELLIDDLASMTEDLREFQHDEVDLNYAGIRGEYSIPLFIF